MILHQSKKKIEILEYIDIVRGTRKTPQEKQTRILRMLSYVDTRERRSLRVSAKQKLDFGLPNLNRLDKLHIWGI